jgi:putative ABC transport system substrate-binding protein
MLDLRRRQFITLLGGAATAWPLAARAQQGERMRRIGVLMATAESDAESQHRLAALREGLQKFGWTEGRNLRSEYCWGANDLDRMRTCAEELAALKPEVIFAAPTSALAAMHRATSTIPIVFAQVADPVANGLVASNSHPGGNITGFATYEYAVGLKWVELLKQIAPQVTRIAVLYDPEQPAAAGYVAAIEAAARSFSVRVVPGAVRDAAAIERTIEAFAGEPNGGLILPPTAFTVATPRADHFTGGALPPAEYLRAPLQRRGWRPCLVRRRQYRSLPPRGGICRSHPQGREARRSADPVRHQIRAGRQSQDR